MQAQSKTIIIILLSLVLMITQNSFAARFGGGKSTIIPTATSRMGLGSALALGAAAGGVGGYMLGHNTASATTVTQSQAQAPAPAQAQTQAPVQAIAQATTQAPAAATTTQSPNNLNNIPWGIIGILIALLVFGLILFRKKTDSNLSPTTPIANSSLANNISQVLGRTNIGNPMSIGRSNTLGAADINASNNMEKMPDGIEKIYFLRQVKGIFLHIQSMNNADNVVEIEKYMLPNLYQEMKDKISHNDFIADFSNLDCQLVNCEMNNTQLTATVKFIGTVSEIPGQPSKQFSELWNFIKKDIALNSKWLVASIQQETPVVSA